MHRPEDAALHRLQAVAHVGQRAADDDAHRVLEERGLDLLGERARRDVGVGASSVSCVVLLLRRAIGPPVCTTSGLVLTRRGSGRLWRSAGSSCRRASTSSPIRIDSTSSAIAASSTSSCTRLRVAGSMHVSRSSCGSISPRPLNRANCELAVRVLPRRARSRAASSATYTFCAADLDRVERRLRDVQPARLPPAASSAGRRT